VAWLFLSFYKDKIYEDKKTRQVSEYSDCFFMCRSARAKTGRKKLENRGDNAFGLSECAYPVCQAMG